MTTLSRTARHGFGALWQESLRRLLRRIALPRASFFGLLMVGALFAFETFNYSTTEFALTDLLGDLRFAGMRWSTLLALAFCGMDFAGVAKLFAPRSSYQSKSETYYLLGAWLLAATMNALLTWWAVSLALLSHNGLGNEILGRDSLLASVPVFVAILVWLIRVLMIGTFAMAGSRLLSVGRPLPPSAHAGHAPPVSAAGKPESEVRYADRPVRPAPKQAVRRNGAQRLPNMR